MAESINNIRSGLNVYGYVWVAVDNRDQRKFKFVADIPQLLLYKNILKFDYNVCKFDIENEVLYLKIKSAHQDDVGRPSNIIIIDKMQHYAIKDNNEIYM